MKLTDTTQLYAGGPGSGCHGENCGRPKLYHMTEERHLKSILRSGIKTEKTGAKSVRKGWDRSGNAVYAFEKPEHAPDVKWSLQNDLNPNNKELLGKKLVVVEFAPSGKYRRDPEYDDYEVGPNYESLSAVIHKGPVSAKNITGYYEVKRNGNLGKYTKIRD